MRLEYRPDIAGVLDEFDPDPCAAVGFARRKKWICSTPNFGQFREDLFPFLGRQFAAAAIEFNRVGAIGALQAGQRCVSSAEHRERNAEGFRDRARAFCSSTSRGAAGRRTGIC